jgi:general stress protein YciG
MNEKEAARVFASMGGKARAKKLSKARRSEIARKGGEAKAARRKK